MHLKNKKGHFLKIPIARKAKIRISFILWFHILYSSAAHSARRDFLVRSFNFVRTSRNNLAATFKVRKYCGLRKFHREHEYIFLLKTFTVQEAKSS